MGCGQSVIVGGRGCHAVACSIVDVDYFACLLPWWGGGWGWHAVGVLRHQALCLVAWWAARPAYRLAGPVGLVGVWCGCGVVPVVF